MIDKIGEVAGGTIDALKGQPMALALVVVNVLFLCVVVFMLMKISESTGRRDALIQQIAMQCFK